MIVMGLIKFLVFLVAIHEPVISKTTDYCKMSNSTVCLERPHLLCEADSLWPIGKTTINSILKPFNGYREFLRQYGPVCNLNDLKWNEDLALMAQLTFKKSFEYYCSITTTYKNMLQFSQLIINGDRKYPTDSVISTELYSLTQSVSPNPNIRNPPISWMFSAYSTEIGCMTFRNRLNCIINGIELNYFNQSFGYDRDCNNAKSTIGEKICADAVSTCNDHFICNPFQDFGQDVEPLTMDFTSTRFIVTKFELTGKRVVWDIDLQYFAEQIVAQALNENDKCLAQDRYVNLSAIHFSGIHHFHEQMSNIDNVWVVQEVGKAIGCAPFNTTMSSVTYYNLYCLTGNNRLERNYLKKITDSVVYRVHLLILGVLVVVLSISLCCLKLYIKCVLEKLVPIPTTNVELDDCIYEDVF